MLNSMQRFFKSIDELKQYYYRQVVLGRRLVCQHCFQSLHWVLHSMVYKYFNHGIRRVAGQRLFCSNRTGRKGCGRTLRLYIALYIPNQQYHCEHWFEFVNALVCGHCIERAYMSATGTTETRHAYRWIRKLKYKQFDFRTILNKPTEQISNLFTVLSRLFQNLFAHCQDYQYATNQAWV